MNKKVFFGIFAVVVGILAIVNLNIALNNKSNPDLALFTLVSLAQNENGTGTGTGESGNSSGWASIPADRDCGLYYFPGYGWLTVSCQYDYCLTNASGSCQPGGSCCPS